MKHILITVLALCALWCKENVHAIENGTWIHHQRQAPTSNILSIYSLNDSTIWTDTIVESQHRFHVFDGVKWSLIKKTTAEFGSSAPLIKDSNDRFYFLKEKNLVVWDFTAPDSAPQSFIVNETGAPGAMAAALTEDNILYLASFNYNSDIGGLYRFDGSTVERIRTGPVKSVAVDTDGRIWITVKDSLSASMQSASMQLLVTEDGNWSGWEDYTDEIDPALISSIQMKVASAPDGGIWVTNLGKYSVYKDGEWSYRNGGTINGTTFSLAFGYNDSVWGYDNTCIYKLDDDGNWQESYNKGESSPSVNGPSFLAHGTGTDIWIFYNQDIYRYMWTEPTDDEKEPWEWVRSEFDLGSDIITSIAYTGDGQLVCGHGLRGANSRESKDEGISILIDGLWHNFQYKENLSLRNVKLLLEFDGDVMIYSDSAYIMYDGRHFEPIDSLYGDDGIKREPNDMIADKQDEVWLATDNGLLHHIFVDRPDLHSPPIPSVLHNLYNLYRVPNGEYFMQASDDNQDNQMYGDGLIMLFDPDESFENQWINMKLSGYTTDTRTKIRDFFAQVDQSLQIGYLFWGIQGDRLVNSYNYNIFNTYNKGKDSQGTEMLFPNASLLYYDEEDEKIWVSGYDRESGAGSTGYLENDIWHGIPELQGYASSKIAFFEDGNIALNALIVNQFGDYPTEDIDDDIDYYGLFEFVPGDPSGIAEQRPANFPTAANYPNPFNASTTISFDLPNSGDVEISVYNSLGQHVKTLFARGTYPAGTVSVVWDSTSDAGTAVSSGIYFYRIETESAVYSGKMLLLR